MPLSRRFVVSLLLAGVVVGLACKDGGPEPIVPTTIAIVDGDNQTGGLGTTLPVNLKVRVTGSDNQPFAGGRVVFGVASGVAGLTPTSDSTDANGEAETTLTFGATPGAVTVTASIGGAPAATFNLTALNPCAVDQPFAVGQSVTGALTAFDCAIQIGQGVFFTDFYLFTLAAPQSISIHMSATFDTFLELYRTNDRPLAFNDDSLPAVITNSFIRFIGGVGSYVAWASTFDANITGAYVLTAAAHPATAAGCEEIWLTRGVAISDMVAATDCADSSLTGDHFGDWFALVLESGQSLSATLTAPTFDPRASLHQVGAAGLTQVATADGTAGGAAAQLNFTSVANAVYVIKATTAVDSATGAYTLTLAGPVAGSAAVQAPMAMPAAAHRAAVLRSLHRAKGSLVSRP
jgi:hypothetical protein